VRRDGRAAEEAVEKEREKSVMLLFAQAAPAVLTYCLCSMSMIFTNKLVLSTYEFNFAATLLVVQSAIAVASLKLLAMAGVIKLEPFEMKKAVQWAPVTVFFGLMLYTGSKTLVYLSIPVMTVFKNLTNLIIAYGDWYFFGERVTRTIIISFAMMVAGSVLTGYYDLEFNAMGYAWMSCNCCAQAAYVLYMRQGKKTTKLSEWGMSFYNNLLCCGMMIGVTFGTGEFMQSLKFASWGNAGFLMALSFSGLIGTGLSLSVFWCITSTSPTTYSMIGALNKIPITIFSVIFFHVLFTWKTAVSVSVGLSAGIVYTKAKLDMRSDQSKGGRPVQQVIVDSQSPTSRQR